jgi:hypothetical protein
MNLPKIIFIVAGAYGLVTLIPHFFFERRIGITDPPAITHPEYFYGFLGVALAWQILFFIIALNPRRYRSVMPMAFLEKLGFGAAAVTLFIAHRVQTQILVFGLVDLFLGVLFLYAYAITPDRQDRLT